MQHLISTIYAFQTTYESFSHYLSEVYGV